MVPLQDIIQGAVKRVPNLLQACCKAVEAMGFQEEGIYRKSGLVFPARAVFVLAPAVLRVIHSD